MKEYYLKIIWEEYGARNGFCVQLRSDLYWDKEAFNRLTEAMRACCKQYEIPSEVREQRRQKATQGSLQDDLFFSYTELPERLLPSWLAHIFWFLSHFVRDWTSHESWEADRIREPEYFNKAYRRLDALASWFFSGNCPWQDEEKGWAQTFV